MESFGLFPASGAKDRVVPVSLTSHLKDRSSEVRAFFEANFPNTMFQSIRDVSLESRIVGTTPEDLVSNKREDSLGTWNPGAAKVLPLRHENYPWAIVGTAFDYRLRYFLEVTPPDQLIAKKGAMQLGTYFDLGNYPPAFLELESELARISPNLGPKELTVVAEDRLARLCFVLALYENCFRARIEKTWPLVRLGGEASLAELLSLCSDDVAKDLSALSSLFFATQQELIMRTPKILNPNFGASPFLGGADADLILGNRLIDIKTVKDAETSRQNLWQLAGYVLSDLQDVYKIDEVGFYFSRHGMQLSWKTKDFFDHLADAPVEVAKLREQFAELLHLRRNATMKAFGVEVPGRKEG